MRRSWEAWLAPLAFTLACALAAVFYWRLRLDSSYVDESDTMVSGWLISRGRHMYSEIWSQHAPLEFMVAQLAALLFPAAEPWQFRLLAWLAVLGTSLSLAFSPLFESRRTGLLASAWFLVFMALVTPRWYGHLLTGNLLWGCAYSCGLGLLILPAALGKTGDSWHCVAGGFFLGLAALGSPITAYPLGLAAALLLLAKPSKAVWISAFAGLGLALLLAAAWIALFGDGQAMVEQVIRFNAEVYGRWSGEDPAPLALLSRAMHDLYGVATEGEPAERALLLAAFASSLAVFLRAKEVSLGRRMGMAMLACLMLMSLRLRGQHWRALPFYAGCAAFWALSLGFSEKFWRLASLVVLGVTLVRITPTVMQHLDRDDFSQYRRLGAYIDSRTKESDTILVLPTRSAIYLAAKREPAQWGVNYYPWQSQAPAGPDALCHEMALRPPSFIVDEADAKIWNYAWKDYQPACLTLLLKKDYRSVKGMKDLWEKR